MRPSFVMVLSMICAWVSSGKLPAAYCSLAKAKNRS